MLMLVIRWADIRFKGLIRVLRTEDKSSCQCFWFHPLWRQHVQKPAGARELKALKQQPDSTSVSQLEEHHTAFVQTHSNYSGSEKTSCQWGDQSTETFLSVGFNCQSTYKHQSQLRRRKVCRERRAADRLPLHGRKALCFVRLKYSTLLESVW